MHLFSLVLAFVRMLWFWFDDQICKQWLQRHACLVTAVLKSSSASPALLTPKRLVVRRVHIICTIWSRGKREGSVEIGRRELWTRRASEIECGAGTTFEILCWDTSIAAQVTWCMYLKECGASPLTEWTLAYRKKRLQARLFC